MIRQDYRMAIENTWLELARNGKSKSKVPTRYEVFNISRGGLRFQSSEIFEPQERVKITLHLLNNAEHHTLARICYCESDAETSETIYYGVSFLENFLDMAPFQKPLLRV